MIRNSISRFESIIPPILFILMVFYSCRDDEMQGSKYDRPTWLAGKLYTQIKEQPELSDFTRCIELTGYDSIINVSGSYTVFAPSNQAINSWLAQNPNFSSVEDIPIPELTSLVKYHIIQNPWTKAQLRSLDVFGWIDTLDIDNNKPRGNKRQTLLKEPDRKFGWGEGYNGQPILKDTLNASLQRKIITNSRKYAPFFYQEYFNIYDLLPGDYEFYFNRPFENMHFANARLVGDEIFAENGFIFIIDQVVDPLRNAYEILEGENGGDLYSQYLELVYNFPDFEYNDDMTFKQEGADQGLSVDSLFDLTFPEMTFNILSERTQPPPGTYGLPQNVTIRYQHGLMAPTNSAFEGLINEYIKIPNGWGSLDNAPNFIKRIIANTHMSVNAVYPSDFERGFYNGEQDMVKINQDNIVQKEYGTNATFIGLNEAIVPRAFSSITAPVYLRPGFSKVMYAIEQSGLLPLLKRENKDYMFFVESDLNTYQDSSLIYNPITNRFSVYQLSGGGIPIQISVSQSDLRTLLLNHLAEGKLIGDARKEFIPNMAGNYIIINNETGEISGTTSTTIGYGGIEPSAEFPVILFNADNGVTFEINNWFSFDSPSIYTRISTQFPAFHSLLQKAGLSIDNRSRYSFVSDSEFYTIFVPSQAAIDSAGLNSLPIEELRQILLFHFVRGELIFTDGKMNADYFETARIDEKSTPFVTVYSRLYVEPEVDGIRFNDKNGAVYATINESEVSTNLLTGIKPEETQQAPVFPRVFNNAVIHEIDKVLIFEELDTN